MTAVVGILNKQAVAIAADSAVTVGGPNGHKIFNKANKVFALSKKHPVGIMIYNSASFMGTPWETIIKVYRKQLEDNSFPTIEAYEQNFIEFLRFHNYYTDATTQIATLEYFAQNIINSIVSEVVQKNNMVIDNPTPALLQQFIMYFEASIDNLNLSFGQRTEFCSEFETYTFEMFDTYSNQMFEKIKQNSFVSNGIIVSDSLFLKIRQCVYNILRAKENISNYTGLIFTGFGEDEIFPQLFAINVSIAVDNRLRYYIDGANNAVISNTQSSAVCPFAQTDVISTILTGVDPSLENTYLKNFDEILTKYNKLVLSIIGSSDPLLTAQIENLKTDLLVQEYNDLNQQIKTKNYIIPLLDALGNLAKEDLAEMAESLIYLTYLKRRITFAEESVGGPVDVAIISKGDGFVWIKRKHYFRPELNQHFFDNYFKK